MIISIFIKNNAHCHVKPLWDFLNEETLTLINLHGVGGVDFGKHKYDHVYSPRKKKRSCIWKEWWTHVEGCSYRLRIVLLCVAILGGGGRCMTPIVFFGYWGRILSSSLPSMKHISIQNKVHAKDNKFVSHFFIREPILPCNLTLQTTFLQYLWCQLLDKNMFIFFQEKQMI